MYDIETLSMIREQEGRLKLIERKILRGTLDMYLLGCKYKKNKTYLIFTEKE